MRNVVTCFFTAPYGVSLLVILSKQLASVANRHDSSIFVGRALSDLPLVANVRHSLTKALSSRTVRCEVVSARADHSQNIAFFS